MSINIENAKCWAVAPPCRYNLICLCQRCPSTQVSLCQLLACANGHLRILARCGSMSTAPTNNRQHRYQPSTPCFVPVVNTPNKQMQPPGSPHMVVDKWNACSKVKILSFSSRVSTTKTGDVNQSAWGSQPMRKQHYSVSKFTHRLSRCVAAVGANEWMNEWTKWWAQYARNTYLNHLDSPTMLCGLTEKTAVGRSRSLLLEINIPLINLFAAIIGVNKLKWSGVSLRSSIYFVFTMRWRALLIRIRRRGRRRPLHYPGRLDNVPVPVDCQSPRSIDRSPTRPCWTTR
jgi:hypothetical protein